VVIRVCIALALGLLLSSCGAAAPDVPVSSPPAAADAGGAYEPQPGDSAWRRGSVYLDAVDMLIAESYPVQIFLVLRGNLPTPCHKLRIATNAPDPQNRIAVEVYTLADPNAVCIQMLEGFEARVALGSFPGGHYSVWVNGERAGEFDS
jgi:hypothetical protein